MSNPKTYPCECDCHKLVVSEAPKSKGGGVVVEMYDGVSGGEDVEWKLAGNATLSKDNARDLAIRLLRWSGPTPGLEKYNTTWRASANGQCTGNTCPIVTPEK